MEKGSGSLAVHLAAYMTRSLVVKKCMWASTTLGVEAGR